ncbi:MAG TPA: hypothetical protein VJU86_20980 [Pyrinomonadaceae bacterium]|nr:hypothetical protein [Pyrinomonadaceae bacterium]
MAAVSFDANASNLSVSFWLDAESLEKLSIMTGCSLLLAALTNSTPPTEPVIKPITTTMAKARV